MPVLADAVSLGRLRERERPRDRHAEDAGLDQRRRLVERVRALAPEGVDLAFDTAGKGAVPDLIELTGDPARVATIADFGAAALGVKVTGGGDFRAVEALAEAAGLIDDGRLTVPVAQAFAFAQAAEAHRASEGGHVRGKLVLVPG